MLSGERVLIAEDEYFLADDLAKGFGRLGAEIVGPVATLAEGLGLLAARPGITGAVLDVDLRGELSWPLADALARLGVPFVFATGYGRDDLPARFAAVPRWEKPYDLADLADAIAGRRAFA